MSREAKIGMLTGLLVILLVGVLLSEYLGNAAAPTRMAAVSNSGESLRRQVTQPVTVPGMVRETVVNSLVDPAQALPGGTELKSPEPAPTGIAKGPIITAPVLAMVDGPAVDKAPPVVTKEDLTGTSTGGVAKDFVAGEATRERKVADATTRPAPKGEIYVIAKGDNLTSISKKFYKSATEADIARIVAANKAVLKDKKTMLVVGKKLTLPDVPGKTAGKVEVADKPNMPKPEGGKISDLTKGPDGKLFEKIDQPKESTKVLVHVVAKNDTLEAIAKKYGAKDYRELMKAIQKANAIPEKDRDKLQIGQKIKIPALAKAADSSRVG